MNQDARSGLTGAVSTRGVDRVKHCPGCGGTDLDHGPAIFQDYPDNPVFDVLCRECGWSGDISPDLTLEAS